MTIPAGKSSRVRLFGELSGLSATDPRATGKPILERSPTLMLPRFGDLAGLFEESHRRHEKSCLEKFAPRRTLRFSDLSHL